MSKKFECKADELILLKRLDNGQYINLTDLDLDSAKNDNGVYYTPDVDGAYILLFTPLEMSTNFYVSLDNLDVLYQYAPSVKKVKKISIEDLIIAKLMVENTSLRYSVEYDEEDNSRNKIRMYLLISRDNNTRQDVEYVTEFEEAYAEDI